MVGKKFGTEFRTDAPVDAMLVFCIKTKIIIDAMRVLKNVRRQLRNIKKRRTFGESLHFFVQNWRWSFKAFQKQNFLEYASSRYTLENYQKIASKKQLWNHFGFFSENRTPVEIRSKNEGKK